MYKIHATFKRWLDIWNFVRNYFEKVSKGLTLNLLKLRGKYICDACHNKLHLDYFMVKFTFE
jgi:hypothetical protein